MISRKFDSNYALSNYDIGNLMKKYVGDVPYLGTFSRDVVPKITGKCAIIINLDDHTGPGTHWTAFYRDSQSNPGLFVNYYCDSYGLIPPDEITSQVGRIIYNTGILQSDNALCGWICIYVLCELGRGNNFADIIARFDPMPTERNIALIQKYFA